PHSFPTSSFTSTRCPPSSTLFPYTTLFRSGEWFPGRPCPACSCRAESGPAPVRRPAAGLRHRYRLPPLAAGRLPWPAGRACRRASWDGRRPAGCGSCLRRSRGFDLLLQGDAAVGRQKLQMHLRAAFTARADLQTAMQAAGALGENAQAVMAVGAFVHVDADSIVVDADMHQAVLVLMQPQITARRLGMLDDVAQSLADDLQA